MKALLNALTTTITDNLSYLRWIGVIDNEQLPPEEPEMPIIGLRDAGLVSTSQPGKKDLEVLTVWVIPYQSIIDFDPGAAVMGRTELGDQGTGLFDISAALKALLNDNFLGLPFHFAWRSRVEQSQTLVNQDTGRLIQYQRNVFVYRRYV